jgi:hypothetical protein
LEPDAKDLLEDKGFDLPRRVKTSSAARAVEFMEELQGPVALKAVSPKILHKTEHGAVVTGITSGKVLEKEMKQLLALDGCQTVLAEEMVSGIELFMGAKNDEQFGPVIILGMGGIGVEIYNDTAIRMAPVRTADVLSMVDSLKGSPLIKGFRGGSGVNIAVLTDVIKRFSHLAMALEPYFLSMDVNPLICSPERCVVADARIMLI